MKWLRKVWDEYNWLLFLPFILLIGTLIILAIVGIRYAVVLFFQSVPFSISGSLIGGTILFFSAWYLKNKISKNRLGFSWNLVNQISPIGIVVGVLGLIILAASVVYIFLPQKVVFGWELVQTIGFAIFAIAFLYAYICACGSFLGDGILAFRFDTIWSGVFLTLIAIVGVSPIILKIFDYLASSYLQRIWLGVAASGAILILISWFLISYFITPAIYFQPNRNKKNEPNE